MFKKILICFCFTILIACGTSKPIVNTTKSSNPVVRTVRKPITKTIDTNPVVQTKKPETNSNSTNSETPIDTKYIEILEATTRVKVTTAMVLEYIQNYKKIAKEDMLQYGIPASITLGQGILESGAGTGPLSIKANNHFGIKCHKEWTGASVKYDDDTSQECFRKYNNPSESYRDHSLFLTSRERYSNLFKLEKNDYKSWAIGLKNAGYATDSSYPTKLITLIEKYELQKYDAEVLGTDYVSTKVSSAINTNIKGVVQSSQNTHQVEKGDTLYSLSKKYNISVDDLKQKNNISNSGISIGQNLIVK